MMSSRSFARAQYRTTTPDTSGARLAPYDPRTLIVMPTRRTGKSWFPELLIALTARKEPRP